jgi:FMN phosphatase YigB (HAD superfamily)
MKKILLLFLTLISQNTQVFSEIYTSSKITEVKNLFHQDDLWILIDLDNCLFESKQALGHVLWYYDLLDEKLQEGMSKEDAIALLYPEWIKTQAVCPIKPLETCFISLIKELQSKGAIVMGLTHRLPSVAKASIKQVASLGIDFSNSSAWHEEFSPKASYPTLYSQGIIFVNDNNCKGEVFSSFLDHVQLKPRNVLFIDDKLENVEAVEKVLQEMDINYTGIHYTAYKESPPVYFRELADFQYQFLDSILSNEEASLLMQHKQN